MGIESQADNLQRLVERIEGATGPDRELDQDIHELVKLGLPATTERAYHWCAKYTGSIDDARSLVPDGRDWTMSVVAGEPCLVTIPSDDDDAVHGFAATPALALASAALRARITQENSNGRA